jgi:magnesium transporter
VRGVDWPETARKFTTAQLAVFISSRYLVTCHPKKLVSVREALDKCEKSPDLVVSEGSDFILYEILDIMAAWYMRALDRLEEEIGRVEEQILSGAGPSRQEMGNISLMRWNVLHLKRVIAPQRDSLNMLARGDSPYVSGKAQVYFRNVYDQMLRVNEALDTYREVVTDLRDTHLAMVSNRMNEVIKVLTVITTILLPLTVISGIYGMNFQYMPELKWRYGYFAVLALMAALTVVTALLLRRRKWW